MSEMEPVAMHRAREAFNRKWADMSSPWPTEEPEAGDGPIGYAIRAYLEASTLSSAQAEITKRDERIAELEALAGDENVGLWRFWNAKAEILSQGVTALTIANDELQAKLAAAREIIEPDAKICKNLEACGSPIPAHLRAARAWMENSK